MGDCFVCGTTLYGEYSQACSDIIPHSNVSYTEKIAELMGDEFVTIITSADHICKKCTSLFTCMDKLENEMNLVKKPILSFIQKKYGIWPSHQTDDGVEIVNRPLKTEEQLEEENNQKEDLMDVDKNQQNNKKGIVDTDIMLNNHAPTEGSADVEQEEEIENSQEDKTVNEAKSEMKPEPTQEETVAEEEEEDKKDTGVLEQNEVDPRISDCVKEEVDEDNAIVDNKTRDLDIESM